MRLAWQKLSWYLSRRTSSARTFASIAEQSRTPQTIIEKVVQKYAVGLPQGKVVKAGDYVMIRPEHVMTHDNTGPVISKCVINSFATYQSSSIIRAGSRASVQRK